jgi:hypothetical protein
MKNLETWQPKEGELVWVKDHHENWEGKGRIIQMTCGDMLAVVYYSYTWIVLNLTCNVLDLEPYTDQDKKIDFSKVGQWLKCGDNIVEVIIDCDSHCFYGEYLGSVTSCKFSKDLKWKLLTSEQMQPLLDAIAALKESRSD